MLELELHLPDALRKRPVEEDHGFLAGLALQLRDLDARVAVEDRLREHPDGFHQVLIVQNLDLVPRRKRRYQHLDLADPRCQHEGRAHAVHLDHDQVLQVVLVEVADGLVRGVHAANIHVHRRGLPSEEELVVEGDLGADLGDLYITVHLL